MVKQLNNHSLIPNINPKMKIIKSFLLFTLVIFLASCSSHKLTQQRRTTETNAYLLAQGQFSEGFEGNNAVELDNNTLANITNNLSSADTKDITTSISGQTALAPIKLSAVQKAKLAFKYRKEIKAAKKVLKENQATNTNKSQGDGKSQGTALLLCALPAVLLGINGIHRIYLGYTGIGILMILTFGCCGILTIIDFIRILTGDLKPATGDYTDKL